MCGRLCRKFNRSCSHPFPLSICVRLKWAPRVNLDSFYVHPDVQHCLLDHLHSFIFHWNWRSQEGMDLAVERAASSVLSSFDFAANTEYSTGAHRAEMKVRSGLPVIGISS
jgi:hypothetical protein